MPDARDSGDDMREVLARLRKAADIYQATVRPMVLADTPDARRTYDRGKELQADLLDALGDAHRVLNAATTEEERDA